MSAIAAMQALPMSALDRRFGLKALRLSSGRRNFVEMPQTIRVWSLHHGHNEERK
ncbi:hypothetical protein D3C86_1911240 [compost metagenome]